MLVAHIDTVHKKPPSVIYHDPDHNVLWSPDGLGADDRAGVYALLKISKNYKPYLLFTDEEESGGGGAQEFIDIYPDPFDNLNMVIQLDRCGVYDSVFYDVDSQPFMDYINSFGFIEDIGTFSDICWICPSWEINGVNLSVGFYNEHTETEYLNYKHLDSTIQKVCKILSEDIPKFDYEEFYCHPSYRGYYSYSYSEKVCGICGNRTKDLIRIDEDEGFSLCRECYEYETFVCNGCKERFFFNSITNTTAEDNEYCDECWNDIFGRKGE